MTPPSNAARATATIPVEYGFCHAEQRGNAARNCPVPTAPLSIVAEIINNVHRMGGVISRRDLDPRCSLASAG